jgi:hypothetical protein
MLDLDMINEQQAEVLALLKRFEGVDLTAKSSRLFILALAEIDDQYHNEIAESIDESLEKSKFGDAIMLDDSQQRRIGIELECNKSIVYAVTKFIKSKLGECEG